MKKLKIAVISPISWRTPPKSYGPWEQVASNIAEGMVERGHDVTLFATSDSVTHGKLSAVCPSPLAENDNLDSEVYKFLHLGNVFEQADKFDIIHNQFDYYPLVFSKIIQTPIVTTINGFHNSQYKLVYQKYNKQVSYVSISNADRAKELSYASTVYNGINLNDFDFVKNPKGNYLLFIGRVSHDKGTDRAIEVAQKLKMKLVIAGQVPPEEKEYFKKYVEPHLSNKQIEWVGPVGPTKRNKLLGNAIASLHMINFDEPFGLTVAEAMACGTPVVAISRGSMPELITDGVDGFLVKDESEAIQAIENIESIDRANCRAKVEKNFTLEKMIDGYEAVYQKILNK